MGFAGNVSAVLREGVTIPATAQENKVKEKENGKGKGGETRKLVIHQNEGKTTAQ